MDSISYRLEMIGCILANNSAGLDGGVLSAAMSTGVTGVALFTDSSFLSNDAAGYGGVLFVMNSSPSFAENALLLNVSGSKFDGNSALYGSALYLSDGVGANVESSMFSDNFGGCIYSAGSSTLLRMTASVATNNDAVGSSGAVISLGAFKSVVIENCTFQSNTAHIGGAVWLSGTGDTVVITKSIFEDNAADEGGAVVIEGWSITGLVSVTSSVFARNNVARKTSSGIGGALVLDHLQHANISGSIFENNIAKLGSAIFSSSSTSATYITGDFLSCFLAVFNCSLLVTYLYRIFAYPLGY